MLKIMNIFSYHKETNINKFRRRSLELAKRMCPAYIGSCLGCPYESAHLCPVFYKEINLSVIWGKNREYENEGT